jgi:hypothetical protein
MLLEHRHAGYHSRFATSAEGMQLKLGGDECGGKFGVGGRASTGTPYLRRDVVELLAVLIRNDRTACCSGVGSDLRNEPRSAYLARKHL